MFHDSEKVRIPEKQISGWIKTAVGKNEVDGSKLKPKLATKVLGGSTQARLWQACFSAVKELWRRHFRKA